MAAARAVLAHTAEMTGLTFIDVNPKGLTNDATILMGNYSASDGAGAYAYMPGSTASTSSAGDLWINSAPVTAAIRPGSWHWFVMLHELGHSLGLDHPGDYNAGVGVSITYANNAEFVQDSAQYSVESYFGASATGASSLRPDTWMLADIIALQSIYGANMATRTGHTTYGFGTNAGALYDFDVNSDPMICLWDAGGRDTIDVSRHTGAQRVDLREEAFSDVLGFVKNLSIAPGAVIENARGGSGADVIIGNAVGNRLTGGAGNDSLSGDSGNDVLDGGTGSDTMAGGLGNDIYYVDGNGDQVIEAQNEGRDTVLTTTSFTLSDTTFVESLRVVTASFAGNLALTGNDIDNRLVSGAGADTLLGGGGRDIINPGNDSERDVIVFRGLSDTTVAGRDVVQGFDTGEDQLDLRAIDASNQVVGDQDFDFGGSVAGAFAVWTKLTTTATIVLGDVTGDAKADMMIILAAVTDLSASDLIL
jgi:serralysin